MSTFFPYEPVARADVDPTDRGASAEGALSAPSGHGEDSGLARSPSTASDVVAWGPIGPVSSHAKAEEWRFVLQAIRIDSWVTVGGDGLLYVMVPLHTRARAARELGEYEWELRERRTARRTRDVPLHSSSWAAVGIAMLLMAFFLVTGPLQGRSAWFQHGIADTNQILAGALEQTVTALTLHTDAVHVLGNSIVGGLFLTAVHRRFGAGLGTFVVVTAGAAGNLMNAAWHGADHRSLGASTAVMAALGVLAAAQFIRNRHDEPRVKGVLMWAPIAGGLALLGTFGAAPNSDVHAHGFGFLAGLLFGVVTALAFRNRTEPLPAWARFAFGIATVGLVAGAWGIAFVVPAT